MKTRALTLLTLSTLFVYVPPSHGQTDENTLSPVLATSVPEQETLPKPERIRSVVFRGVRSVSEKELQASVMERIRGRADSPGALRLAATAVTDFYQNRKYTLAQVVEAGITADGTLTLVVAEGVIRQVSIQGNERTRTGVIESTLGIGAGQVFNEGRVAAGRQRLARLGIFLDVKVGPELLLPGEERQTAPSTSPDTTSPEESPPGTSPEPPTAKIITYMEDPVGQVDLVVRVREAPTANIAATVGYSDGSGAVGFVDLSENNLFGLAHQATLLWQRTTQAEVQSDGTLRATDSRSAFLVSYTVPGMGPRGVALGVELYDKNTVFLPVFAGIQETLRSYERRRGFTTRLGRAVTDNLTLFTTVRRDQVGYDPLPDDIDVPSALLTNAEATVGAFGVLALLEGRDDVNNPQMGYRHTLQVERASSFLGGNRNFIKTTLDLRGYIPLRTPPQTGRPTSIPVLALRALGGNTSGDVPLSEQYFLGGFDLLRGYDLFSVRGNNMFLATTEVRVPLGQGLQGVVFSDVGNAWGNGTSASAGNFKASLGVGVRFLSPIGPLRVDAAYGSRLQTYVSLGQSF